MTAATAGSTRLGEVTRLFAWLGWSAFGVPAAPYVVRPRLHAVWPAALTAANGSPFP